MRRFILSLAVALGFIAIQGSACMAQSVPSGSYQSSCKNIDVRGEVLSANCQDVDGKWEATLLRDYRSCGSDIVNDNGALRCGNVAGGYQAGLQAGVPNGSYTQSCQDIHAHGDDLEARCQTSDGNWHKTKLDDYQKCRGDVANENGNLRCAAAGYAGGYQGGYLRQLACLTRKAAKTSKLMETILTHAAKPEVVTGITPAWMTTGNATDKSSTMTAICAA